MGAGRIATCVTATLLCWSSAASAMEPAAPTQLPTTPEEEEASPRVALDPTMIEPRSIPVPAMDLPALPFVHDPFRDAPALEIVGQRDGATVASAAAPQSALSEPTSPDELRDPFSENATGAAWAENLRLHRFDALMELLDPFRERDSSASSYRALSTTQRASNGLRDPFSLDARTGRQISSWITDLRNPFDPRARPTQANRASCIPPASEPPRAGCTVLPGELRDPFNSR
jgi:hypothetical protein